MIKPICTECSDKWNIPKCRSCKHYEGVKNFGKEAEADDRNICKAFPKGIPHEIAYGDNKHTEPFSGDHGIQFEPLTTGGRG